MKNFTLGEIDVKKILIHFAIYVLGYAGIAALTFILHLNLGIYGPVISLAAGGLIDTLRKLADGQINA